MARPRIIDAKSCKFTLDVSGDNKETLDELTSNYMLKYGPMINRIIGTFCRMPKNIKKVIENACLTEYRRITEQLATTTEEYHRRPLEQERDSYLDILKLINYGIYEIEEEKKEENKLRKIKLYDGYLIIPSDWIVVNEEKAKNCRYACVLECRNSAKFGVPHFIYLNNTEHACNYTDTMESEFYSLCRKAWPRFDEIRKLSDKNQLVPDPENKGKYLNTDEHLSAPIIGLFSIEEQGSRHYGEPPYGAVIVRTTTENE